jgi:hypothetical protein
MAASVCVIVARARSVFYHHVEFREKVEPATYIYAKVSVFFERKLVAHVSYERLSSILGSTAKILIMQESEQIIHVW